MNTESSLSRRQREWLALGLLGIALASAWYLSKRRWRRFARCRSVEQEQTVEQQREEARPHGKPRPGDILLFFRPARGRDYVIRWVTRSPFYHAALYAGGDTPGSVVEARPQGVIHNSLAGRENNFLVVPAPEGKGAEALAWAKTQLGAQYDHLDQLTILLEHLFDRWHINYIPHGRYTCAELVATAYAHAGVHIVPGHGLDGLDPGDLAVRLVPESVSRSL